MHCFVSFFWRTVEVNSARIFQHFLRRLSGHGRSQRPFCLLQIASPIPSDLPFRFFFSAIILITYTIQYDTLRCFKIPVDIDVKVAFLYKDFKSVSRGGLKQRNVSPCTYVDFKVPLRFSYRAPRALPKPTSPSIFFMAIHTYTLTAG